MLASNQAKNRTNQRKKIGTQPKASRTQKIQPITKKQPSKFQQLQMLIEEAQAEARHILKAKRLGARGMDRYWDGKVRRIVRVEIVDGDQYPYQEVLSCGHRFIPMDGWYHVRSRLKAVKLNPIPGSLTHSRICVECTKNPNAEITQSPPERGPRTVKAILESLKKSE